MKMTFQIEIVKGDGPEQDADEVVDLIREQIEGLGEVYVQDGSHSDETPYAIGEVKHLGTAA